MSVCEGDDAKGKGRPHFHHRGNDDVLDSSISFLGLEPAERSDCNHYHYQPAARPSSTHQHFRHSEEGQQSASIYADATCYRDSIYPFNEHEDFHVAFISHAQENRRPFPRSACTPRSLQDDWREVSVGYRPSTELEMMPCLVGSDTSSFENSWNSRDHDCDGVTMAADQFSHPTHEPLSRIPSTRHLSLDKKGTFSPTCSIEKTVEVFPGEFLRLRGAEETRQAIQNDFFMPCECVCCFLTILCILDADFALCPKCRVVSPMSCSSCNGSSDGGVGLGFTIEDLARFQKDLTRKHYRR